MKDGLIIQGGHLSIYDRISDDSMKHLNTVMNF